MENNKIIPVKLNETLKLAIARFSKRGDPILIYKNFIIFLKSKKGILIDKPMDIKITKIFKKFAFAERI